MRDNQTGKEEDATKRVGTQGFGENNRKMMSTAR